MLTKLATFSVPGSAFGLNDVTSRIFVIQVGLKICTGISMALQPVDFLETNEEP